MSCCNVICLFRLISVKNSAEHWSLVPERLLSFYLVMAKIKLVRILAKTEQTPRKLLYLMNRHDANTLGDTGFFRRYCEGFSF